MLGEIDHNLKPIQPQYFLCKPNREIIGKLNDVFNDSLNDELNSVNEMEFTVPYMIDVRHQLVKNKYVDLIREKYLIKTVKRNKVEWYIVIQITDSVEDDKDVRVVKCYSANHELTNQLIKSYSVVAYACRQVLSDLLKETIWEVDYVDADFDISRRSFEFPSSTILEAIYSVAETYNAIVEFNTDARTVSFKKPELFGLNKGLTFSPSKYLKSMEKIINTEQMVTRLSAYGKDGLTIHKVNPTGQSYIENFGFFMYPFKRDSNKNVLSSSYFMSDSLCHALLDYQELVEKNTGLFDSYLQQLRGFESELNQLDIDLNKLLNDKAVIGDIVNTQLLDIQDGINSDKMFFENFTHSGTSSKSFPINSKYAYAVMVFVQNTTGVTVSLDGQNQTVSPGVWTLLGKKNGSSSTQVSFNGGASNVIIQVATISLTEWQSSNNGAAIIERYNPYNKTSQIDLKKLEILSKENQIKNINSQINSLRNLLLTTNNFTPDQLQELNTFIYSRDFSDDRYIDEDDLYIAVQEKFAELQQPTLSIDIDIVNFLEVVKEQRNWDKLVLGDFVNIKYEPMNINITARISAIEYDYEGSNITLTLSNAKRVDDETKELEKFISNAKNTNIIVDTNKTKWGKAIVDVSEMSQLFENFWNKVTNDINMASNEFVTYDRSGLTIIDPNDPLRFLRATHGVLGLTRSGGLRYETAISPDGVIAEMVLGKIILGQRVVIGTDDGIFTIEGPTLTVEDRCGREVLKLGLLTDNPDVFGTYTNKYTSDICSNLTLLNRTGMDNTRGFYIDRYKNGIARNVFGTTSNGDLYLRAGDNNEVLTIDEYGLGIGSEQWASSPFRVDYNGNCWLYSLWATDAYLVNAYIENAEIQSSLFDNGHIEASTITLRDGLGGVMKLDPSIGFWAGLNAETPEDASFFVSMSGKLKLVGKNGLFFVDTEEGYVDFNNMDVYGIGALDAELLAANIVTSLDGFITNLVASKLTTLTNAAKTGWTDYIRIEGNTQKFITGKIDGPGTPKLLPDGRPLYWADSSQSGQMTTDVTSWPVMVYDMDEKDKMILSFRGSGDSATPYIRMGLGDGTPNGGKAFIEKIQGEWDFIYYNSNYQQERRLLFKDDGIELSSASGDVILKHDNGTSITIKNNGEIDITSTGKINVSGSEYLFA